MAEEAADVPRQSSDIVRLSIHQPLPPVPPRARKAVEAAAPLAKKIRPTKKRPSGGGGLGASSPQHFYPCSQTHARAGLSDRYSGRWGPAGSCLFHACSTAGGGSKVSAAPPPAPPLSPLHIFLIASADTPYFAPSFDHLSFSPYHPVCLALFCLRPHYPASTHGFRPSPAYLPAPGHIATSGPRHHPPPPPPPPPPASALLPLP